MTATIETPIVPGPIQGPTIVEALLLDDYRSLVHLAYLILPPAISRARRVAAAHAVVQRAVPPGLQLPHSLTSQPDVAVPATRHREFLRSRVVQEATRQAAERSLPARLGSVIAPADSLEFDPCSVHPDRTAIHRRCTRGRRITIATTLAITAGILVALLSV
jgi:hypothetical protein